MALISTPEGPFILRRRVWLAPLIVALIVGFFLQNVVREDTLRTETIRSSEAQVNLQRLFSILQDGEIGERGYALSGDNAFLGPFLTARAAVDPQKAKAVALLRRGPGAPAEIDALERLVDRRFALLTQTVEVRRAQGQAAAIAVIARGEGKAVMDQIRTIVSRLSVAETNRLEARLAARLQTRWTVNLLGGLTLLILMGAILFAQWRDQRYQRQRAELLAQLQDQVLRNRAIFDSAMDAILTLNPSGGIESVNGAGERMFGYARGELERRDMSMLTDVARQRFGTFIERLQQGDANVADGIVREMTARRKDGTTFPVDVGLRGMPLPDGLHVVAIVRDISERRRVEAMKEEFVSTVSHELRTPLTSIAGALGLLKGGAGGVLPERAVRLVQIADSNSTRLVRLINDILDMEKFASGQAALASTPQSLSDLAQRAAEMMTGLAEERGVRLTRSVSTQGPLVLADPDRILQVLTNLLSNAIKFSEPGSSIEVRTHIETDRGGVEVVDHGAGVPESFRHRLFQKFAQSDGSDARRHGGTGLGLAISREIADLHGEALNHHPTPGGGATFRLDLPLAAEPVKADATQAPRLLVCEDDVMTAEAMRQELSGLGYDVDVAGAANEARVALNSNRYAALLLDLGLPDADGLSLVRTLRSAPSTRDLPIIIVSGSVDREGDGRLLDIVDWIDKPVSFQRLSAALQTALARSSRSAPLILHVDDDLDLLEVARGVLGGAGEIVAATSLAQARRLLADRRPDVVVLDLGLPDGSGVDLLPDLKDDDGTPIPVIVYTAQDPNHPFDAQVVSVFTKSRVGLQRLADSVRRVTDPTPETAA